MPSQEDGTWFEEENESSTNTSPGGVGHEIYLKRRDAKALQVRPQAPNRVLVPFARNVGTTVASRSPPYM